MSVSQSNAQHFKLRVVDLLNRIYRSIWFFPIILIVALFILVSLKISGTSEGVYNSTLYGTSANKNLIVGRSRGIRSDEWLVNTQAIIAQSKAGFPLINKNIGNGQNMSVVIDVPYKDWSIFFKPQDLGFFIMPLEHAFALRWWLMGFALIIGCYFFALKLLPVKRFLAASISMALFFSAFVQWWYEYQTLGALYYSFFILLTVMGLFSIKNTWSKVVLSLILAYLIACLALVMYPPFQIPCALAIVAISIGYLLNSYKKNNKTDFIRSILLLFIGIIIGMAIVYEFIHTRTDVIKTIENTAYPGVRTLISGGFPVMHFFASHLGYLFLFSGKSDQYLINGVSHTNQSESSNFLLLIPFLFLPCLVAIYQNIKNREKINWSLVGLCILFTIFLCEMFLPSFTPISKLLFLNKVGPYRALIGVGLVNIFVLICLISNLERSKYLFPKLWLFIYCLLIFLFQLMIGLKSGQYFGISLGKIQPILLALPVPIVIYLLLRKYYIPALTLYLLFSIFTSAAVNPLYKGLDLPPDSPLNKAIVEISASSNKRWISESIYLEDVVSANGARSLSGVYDYPQLDLWSGISGVNKNDYNRYAHVWFEVSDNQTQPTKLSLIQTDAIKISTYACSPYLKTMDVGFIIADKPLNSPCTQILRTIKLSTSDVLIYKIN